MSRMFDKNIVLTGSSGFIGTHLKKALIDRGDNVIEWDRRNGRDIKDFTIDPSSTDVVIHLAAIADVRRSIKYPEEYWENNVVNTTKIQRICDKYFVPLFYASSSCIHKWWLSPYGTTKKTNEETARPNQTGLRFTTVYGDGARDTMFMGRLFSGNLEYCTNHIRDFIHVEDVVSAILTLIDSKPGPKERAYNIGTGIGNTVSDLAKLAGYDLPIREGGECEAPDNTADITALTNEFGWKPKRNVRKYIESWAFSND